MRQPHKQLFRYNTDNNTYTHIQTGKVLPQEHFIEHELAQPRDELLSFNTPTT